MAHGSQAAGRVWNDVRFALTMMRTRVGLALLAVLTLALGIGANTALFSVVDAVVLRPLPYKEADRLFLLHPTNPTDGQQRRPVRGDELRRWRPHLGAFGEVAAGSAMWNYVLTSPSGERVVVPAVWITANLLATLGIEPLLGRGFAPQEDVPGGPRVAMLAHAAWQRRFGGDPGVIGQTVDLASGPVAIVGVMPAAMQLFDPAAEFFLPLGQNGHLVIARRSLVVARLADRVSEGQARAALAHTARVLAAEEPSLDGFRFELEALKDQLTAGVRPALLLLFAAVGLVLLIACVNVANLMLARAIARRKEIAVRAALGAGRGRLLRQLLTEGVLLALLGGVAGVALARVAIELVLALYPVPLPAGATVELNGSVLAFTCTVSLLVGVAFSLAPALHAFRVDPQGALGDHRGATADRGQRRLSNALVVAEISLALVVLVGAGLLARSLARVMDVHPGFSPENLLTMRVYLQGAGFGDERRRTTFFTELDRGLRALPGVTGVGVVTRLPLQPGRNNVSHAIEREDLTVAPLDRPEVDVRRATSGYFPAMNIALRAGRLFGPAETTVAVINERAAERLWPGQSPLGKRVRTVNSGGDATPWFTVVGVVGSVRHLALDEAPRREVYYPLGAGGGFASDEVLVVRSAADPARATAAVRAAIAAINPRVAIGSVEPMATLVARSLAPRRFGMTLVAIFAALALLLAGIGLYGVIAYAVAQRTQEIGVRMALGAQARDVVGMVLGQGLRLTLAGTALGLAGALALGRVLAGMLYEVSATDPITLGGVVAVLVLVAGGACYLPARRATLLHPAIALRRG